MAVQVRHAPLVLAIHIHDFFTFFGVVVATVILLSLSPGWLRPLRDLDE